MKKTIKMGAMRIQIVPIMIHQKKEIKIILYLKKMKELKKLMIYIIK
jgi:hypothetical protein